MPANEAIRRIRHVFSAEGADKVVAAHERVAQSQREIVAASSSTEKATLSLERRFASIERRYNATIRAQQDYERVQRQVNAAVAQNPELQQRANCPSPSPPTERPLDLAAAIVAAMRRKGYIVDTQPGEINIIYVEGLNEDGTVNDDAADKWNDLRVVIGFEGDKPVILGKWRATTEPGRYYTEHPVNPAGAARIEFGQYQAWRVGMHRGDHEALVQRGKVTVCRDLNKDMIRTGDARDTGDNFGINQHGPSGAEEAPDDVGRFSAGCLVGKSMAGHRAFMAIVKADPRFVADPDYLFRTAILAERDVASVQQKRSGEA